MELKLGLLLGLFVVLVISPTFVTSDDEIATESDILKEQPQNDMPINFDELIFKKTKNILGLANDKKGMSFSGGAIKTGGYNSGRYGSGGEDLFSGSGYGGVKTSQQFAGASDSRLNELFKQFGPQQPGQGQYMAPGKGNQYSNTGVKAMSSASSSAYGAAMEAGCKISPPKPLNGDVKCSSDSGSCRATCKKEYQFPNGDSVLYISCIDDEWVVKDSEWGGIPACEPICLPKCQNNGICIAPGQCECSENFHGPQCQHEKKLCLQRAPLAANSQIKCSATDCTVTCRKGYRFPDGSTVTNMVCKDGEWTPSKIGWDSVPDCQPTCTPACQNGGTCLSFNVCQCPEQFRGHQCQYSVERCSPKKMKFNGGYNCAGDENVMNCTLYCPSGVDFDVKPAPVYTCNYKDAKFMPSRIPECVFDEGVSVSHFHSNYSMMGQTQKYISTPGVFSMYYTQGIDMTRKPNKGVCMTWNGNKVKTFDGMIYSASLSCSHTLFHDKIDGLFSVILRDCPYGETSCNVALIVYLNNVKYTFENDKGQIKFYTVKAQLQIPAQMPGLRVNLVGSDLQIVLEQIQTTIKWESHKFVTVEASAALWNRTAGLCGTFDSDLSNEFASKDGSVHASPRTFVDAWQAPTVDLDPSKCIMVDDIDYDEQKYKLQIKQTAELVCKKLLNNKKLEACAKKFNMDMLMRSCVSDYYHCYNKNNPKECACNGIAVLVKDCSAVFEFNFDKGWRDPEICPISCPYGRVYKECGPSVPETCGQAVLTKQVGGCVEGCFCPDGLVQSAEGKCVDRSECPCKLKGKSFQSGSTVKRDCNTCSCYKGSWKCSDLTCGSRCGAVGDPHYVTFDGRRYDFMGKCSYYLIKTPNITVVTENVPCSGSISEEMGLNVPQFDKPSCTKSATITYSINGVASKIELKQGRRVFLNGAALWELPRELSNGYVKIRHASSSFLLVHFQDDFKVWWDGATRVYVDAPASYRGKTSGLCGTFNANSQDDFLTPEGDIESVPEPFADKWKTKEVCSVPTSAAIIHPCQKNPEMKGKAEEVCAKLKSRTFEDCHWQVDPQSAYDDCMYDVCACEGPLDHCLCPIFSAYAAECANQGVVLNWRYDVSECAIKCPAGQVYEECGDSCTLSCQDLNSETLCKPQCIEGCRCPEGQALENNECIPRAMCTCRYKGLTFNPGHKEVRPGNKFLQLCACSAGKWLCDEALNGDDIKFPPSQDQQSKCLTTKNEEFTTCEPAEPITCKNMHYYQPSSPNECTPGCVCKKGFVLDMVLKKCVLPQDCSCHHGGRSYSDKEKIQQDCNSCVCISGKWDCEKSKCPSVCSSWGDSHFTTFDGKDFDFQGVCNYVLSKADLNNGKGFSVVIQNVLCGSMGETCSKSVLVTAKNQSLTETVELNDDMLQPGSKTYYNSKSQLSHKVQLMNIYRAGVFLIVQIPHLDISVEWDRGTRVYVKLSNQWRGLTQGLCGNYNGDIQDDMKNPSNGLEVSPNLFGDSWKAQTNCAQTKPQSDSCSKHPERSAWSQRKCGLLKSSIFSQCHAEVPIDNYYKRCTHDACACDQGGDCECLCTALAAYAAACSRKGIHIRWRTPDLCPMQCDPICSNYLPCIPKCPVETCDTGVESCVDDGCVEGCQLKGCPDGMVYANETYKECVPKATCKPVCKIINGKTYYEGDITEKDACHTCRCTKNSINCIGKPCPDEHYETTTKKYITTTTPKPIQDQVFQCKTGWSEWLNQDQDFAGGYKGTKTAAKKLKIGDKEPLPTYYILRNFNGGACPANNITKVECRTVLTHKDPKITGQDVECSTDRGLVCSGPCDDYEMRVYCECGSQKVVVPPKPDRLTTVCDPTIPHVEYPGDCYKFRHCQPAINGSWVYAIKTCGPSMMYNPEAMVCDHISRVIEMKPICGGIIPVPPGENEIPNNCPPGMEWSECATPCRKACLYYGNLLMKSGNCKFSSNDCEPGCVDKTFKMCKMGLLWRDQATCVDLKDCTCMSHTGQMVKPGQVIKESKCEACQCIGNVYVCDKSICNTVDELEKEAIIKIKKNDTKVVIPGYDENKIVDVIPTVQYNATQFPIIIVPSTVAPPPKCENHRLTPMFSGDQGLPDSAFSASSSLSNSYKPQNSRLNSKPDGKSAGAWAPEKNRDLEYIQVTFKKPTPLFGVLLQGSPIVDNYVTMFKIMYSVDGAAFSFIREIGEDRPQLFYGPIDSRTPIESEFLIPIEAKIVRLYPLTWHEGIAIRWELLGCGTDKKPVPLSPVTTSPQVTTLKPPVATTPKIVDTVELPMCDDPMGVENGKMSPPQVSVSSQKDKQARPIDVMRLSSKTGWVPNLSTPNEYILFNFMGKRNLTGVITKGGSHGFVTAFNVFYSHDRTFWNPVTEADQSVRVFRGNADDVTTKVNYFKKPIQAQYLKIVPIKWSESIVMKVEPIGCFQPYPVIEDHIVPTTAKPLSQLKECGVCPGVQTVNFNQEIDNTCKCYAPQFWNGQECISKTKCPCMVGYTSYEVGAHYKNDECKECICTMGGVSSCQDISCPKCKPGQRASKNKFCDCVCEDCPPGTVICKTSGVCIPKSSWCNGIVDCPDDEVNCQTVGPAKPTISTIYNQTKTCPTPECQPGFQIKQINKRPPLQSVMFDQQSQMQQQQLQFTKNPTKSTYATRKMKDNMGLFSRFGEDDPFQTFLPPPPPPQKTISKIKMKTYSDDEEKCIEYICVPSKEPPPPEYKIICPPTKCPPGYTLVVDPVTNPKSCATFDCKPERLPDAICNVTGRTFNTFDDIEFKYDICSHVLAREFSASNWTIVLSKRCDKMSCKKELEILDKSSSIVIKFNQDLMVDFNGYKYTVEQLQKSPSATTFVVSKNGDTVIFVSHIHGFWVKFNNFGDVEIGVSQKYRYTVDGLCGYYNEFPEDDKRLPNGDAAVSTVEFGDSWKMPDRSMDECEPHVCPKQIQDQAWEMCNSVRHESFGVCGKTMDIDKFVSRCIETACECLKETSAAIAGTKTSPLKMISTSKCKCAILQKFATDCMAADNNAHLDMWRSIHGCEITCPQPLVHKDCYRRRCEFSCENMNQESCPYLPGQCFSGCYCPDGMVRKGQNCVVAAQECRDCVCDNLGRTDFVTYDGRNFTFAGNCTYLMTRDLVIPGKMQPDFQIYASFGECVANQKGAKLNLSCAKKLFVVSGDKVLKIALVDEYKMKVSISDTEIRHYPLIQDWVKVEQDLNYVLTVTLAGSFVKISNILPQNGDIYFTIKVPGLKYSNKMEGLCGNCNRNPNDDLVLNPKTDKKPTNTKNPSIQDIAESWLSNEKLLNVDNRVCVNKVPPKQECPQIPPEQDLCNKILDSNIFGQCFAMVDPIAFVSQCTKDTCLLKDNKKAACQTISSYVKQCNKNYICVDWRKDGMCPYNCPADMLYESCGCPETCESIKQKEVSMKSTKTSFVQDVCNVPSVEGCFCPRGKVMRDGKCISLKECTPCDDLGHYVGDLWHPEKCTHCECLGDGKTVCSKQLCSETVCAKGMKASEVGTDGCCKKFVCVEEPKSQTKVECPKAVIPTCNEFQVKKLDYDVNHCQKYICDCKPASECPKSTIDKNQLKPGEKIVKENSGCCPVEKKVCDLTLCPKPIEKCSQMFFVTQKMEKKYGDCCDSFQCVPPKDKCIVEIEGKPTLKGFGNSWPTPNPCITKVCTIDGTGKPKVQDDIETCLLDGCKPGYELEVPKGACCGKCVQKMCVLGDRTYQLDQTWKGHNDNCTTYKCSKRDGLYYIESESETCPEIFECPDHRRYFKGCCQFCKPEPQDQKNCMPLAMSEPDTVQMIKKIVPVHGICINKIAVPKFMECYGSCSSGTKYNKAAGAFEKKCDCCSIKELTNVLVELTCLDNYKMKIDVAVPKVCGCVACTEQSQQQQQQQSQPQQSPTKNGLSKTKIY